MHSGIPANQHVIHKKAQPNSERNHTKSRGYRSIWLNPPDQDKSHNVSERAGYQQNSRPSRTRRLREFRLHGNIHAARNRRQPLLAAQLAYAEKGVHRRHGDSEDHDHRRQPNKVPVHKASSFGREILTAASCHDLRKAAEKVPWFLVKEIQPRQDSLCAPSCPLWLNRSYSEQKLLTPDVIPRPDKTWQSFAQSSGRHRIPE